MYTAKNLDNYDLIEIYYSLEEIAERYSNDCKKAKEDAKKDEKLKNTYTELANYYERRRKEIRAIQKKIRVE